MPSFLGLVSTVWKKHITHTPKIMLRLWRQNLLHIKNDIWLWYGCLEINNVLGSSDHRWFPKSWKKSVWTTLPWQQTDKRTRMMLISRSRACLPSAFEELHRHIYISLSRYQFFIITHYLALYGKPFWLLFILRKLILDTNNSIFTS